MVGKNRRIPKCLGTQVTGVRTFICVNTSVSLKIRRLAKGFATRVAHVLSEGSTSRFLLCKMAPVTKCSVTHVRAVNFFTHMNLFTTGNTASLCKGAITHERFLIAVNTLVSGKIICVTKCHVTLLTYVGLLGGMKASVSQHIDQLTKRFGTHIAQICSVSDANVLIPGKIARVVMRFAANTAYVRNVTHMKSFVFDKTVVLSKGLVTQVTNVTSVFGMKAFVTGKIRRVLKCLATQITGVRTFICVSTSVFLEITGQTKAFVTHVTNIHPVITANTFAFGNLAITDMWFCRNIKLMWFLDHMTSFMTDKSARLSI